MATVVLTAVGTLLGGPIGGAIGAALGQRIDQAVLGSGKPREGPRLKELEVQTSSYGTQIPAIFGTMRVAGTVIWSTDLIEQRVKSGGGKGRPASVNYSYSASFAVALSSRAVERIGRIWADGNLLRGAAGDFKTETVFRFHPGHGDQPLDPLLASAELGGQCPAYRDVAYAVFEDLQLADYGNRIPSLTFEVFEREETVSVGEIASVASAGLIEGEASAMLGGYAVQGRDCRSALEPILAAMPVVALPDETGLRLVDWSAPAAAVSADEPAISDGATRLDRPAWSRESGGSVPTSVSIRHYEPARDFQAGIQASRQIALGRGDLQIDLPACVDADRARGFADLQLLQRRRGLNGRSLALPIGPDAIRAGMTLGNLPNSAPMRITEIEHFLGTTRILAREWSVQSPTGLMADPGRNRPGADLAAGATRLVLLDLPALEANDQGRPSIAIAAAGTGAGWRRAALSMQDGERSVDLGGTNGVATIGSLAGGLESHSPFLLDKASRPVISLLHDAMALPPGTGDPTSFDAPSIWLGGEILRYGRAEKVGARDYRLNELLRGCFGTGDAILDHPDGTECVLLEPQSLLQISGVPLTVGSTLHIEALGVGDMDPVERTVAIEGLAITPRSPVHGRIEQKDNGDISLSWVRRDRLSHGWTDSVDIPNSEGFTQYAVELLVSGVTVGQWTSASEGLVIQATEIETFLLPPSAQLVFSIIQQGRYARSAPLLIEATL